MAGDLNRRRLASQLSSPKHFKISDGALMGIKLLKLDACYRQVTLVVGEARKPIPRLRPRPIGTEKHMVGGAAALTTVLR